MPRTAPRLRPWQLKWLMRLYPPLLFNRIVCTRVGADFRELEVRVRKSWLNRNLNGTIFGGTISAAFDPWYGMLYWQLFAHRRQPVQVWVKALEVTYHQPAATDLFLRFRVADDELAQVEAGLAERGKKAIVYHTDALDRHGQACATAKCVVVVRLVGPGQAETVGT